MKRFALALIACLMLASPALAFQAPCSGQYVGTTIPLTASSSATSKLITGSATQAIYVCAVWLQNSGGTTLFDYGTGSTCGTGTVNLTGTLASSTLINQVSPGTMEVWEIPPGQNLCLVGGASAAGTGYMTYVAIGGNQRP